MRAKKFLSSFRSVPGCLHQRSDSKRTMARKVALVQQTARPFLPACSSPALQDDRKPVSVAAQNRSEASSPVAGVSATSIVLNDPAMVRPRGAPASLLPPSKSLGLEPPLLT